jgi:mannose-6-phosphate isomerase-like protein (cupin superfamily)
MNLRVRRVVTGHNPQRKAIVTSDEILPNLNLKRPGQQACAVWATDRVPADNLDPEDGARKTAATTLPNGVVFRIVRYEAGTVGRMHRTTTLDYAIVQSGSMVLLMDDDVEVTLHAGDVLVQRGTLHNWINRGAEPCTIAFVLIDAASIAMDGHSPDVISPDVISPDVIS